jgi:hypothetical protein
MTKFEVRVRWRRHESVVMPAGPTTADTAAIAAIRAVQHNWERRGRKPLSLSVTVAPFKRSARPLTTGPAPASLHSANR